MHYENQGRIAKLPSLECEASYSNSECGFFDGFTYILNFDCEASQYKLKTASFTYILQSVSMKRQKNIMTKCCEVRKQDSST